MRIDFESKPVYSDDNKYLKINIKIYAGSMVSDFQNKKIPKEKAPCKCLLIIMLDSVIKVNKNIILKHFQKDANMYKKR